MLQVLYRPVETPTLIKSNAIELILAPAYTIIDKRLVSLKVTSVKFFDSRPKAMAMGKYPITIGNTATIFLLFYLFPVFSLSHMSLPLLYFTVTEN